MAVERQRKHPDGHKFSFLCSYSKYLRPSHYFYQEKRGPIVPFFAGPKAEGERTKQAWHARPYRTPTLKPRACFLLHNMFFCPFSHAKALRHQTCAEFTEDRHGKKVCQSNSLQNKAILFCRDFAGRQEGHKESVLYYFVKESNKISRQDEALEVRQALIFREELIHPDWLG